MLSCFSDCEETTLPGLSSLDSVLRILEVIAASDGTRDALAISGLNATARIGVEIINVIKKLRTRKSDWIHLAERIAWLLIPVEEAIRGHEVSELDPVLKFYLQNLKSDLEKILLIVRGQPRPSRFRCMTRSDDHAGDLAMCEGFVDRAYRIPAVHYWPPESTIIRPGRMI